MTHPHPNPLWIGIQAWFYRMGQAQTNAAANRKFLYPIGKRGFDILLAVLLGIFTLPILFLVGVLVKLSDGGPIFYCQVRLGKNGQPYTLIKIRTMVIESEKDGACWSSPADPRITPVGRFLRRTHLDEIPQLWNVLRGDMSLIGPRPERPEFFPALIQSLPRYPERLLVRPGITGLAQVQLPPDTDLESVRQKLARDLFYIQHASARLDLQILLATACKMMGFSFPLLTRLFRLPREMEVPEFTGNATPNGTPQISPELASLSLPRISFPFRTPPMIHPEERT